jgi:hypothetical protein
LSNRWTFRKARPTTSGAALPALVDLLGKHLRLDDALQEAADELSVPSVGHRRDEYAAELAKIEVAQQRLVDAVADGLLPAETIRQKQLDLLSARTPARQSTYENAGGSWHGSDQACNRGYRGHRTTLFGVQ